MAEAIRPGGVYKVGDEYQDANGNKVDAPTKEEMTIPAGEVSGGEGPLDGLDFASDEAAEEASRTNLSAADFEGLKPSGAGGFTKADVAKAAAAKEGK